MVCEVTEAMVLIGQFVRLKTVTTDWQRLQYLQKEKEGRQERTWTQHPGRKMIYIRPKKQNNKKNVQIMDKVIHIAFQSVSMLTFGFLLQTALKTKSSTTRIKNMPAFYKWDHFNGINLSCSSFCSNILNLILQFKSIQPDKHQITKKNMFVINWKIKKVLVYHQDTLHNVYTQ